MKKSSNDAVSTLIVLVIVKLIAADVHIHIARWILNGTKANGDNNSNWKRASIAFGMKARKLKKLSKKELKKLYRMLANECHPDHGGSSELFNELHDAYEFAYERAYV